MKRRFPPVYTQFDRFLALWECVTGLFRPKREMPCRRVRLSVEGLEIRLALDARPLPNLEIFVGAGIGQTSVVNAYAADRGELIFQKQVYRPEFTGGVRVAAGDFNDDGVPDVLVAPGAGHSPRLRILDGKTGDPVAGPLRSFLAFSKDMTGVYPPESLSGLNAEMCG